MQRAGITGDYLAWRDALHAGPVPADLSFEQMAQVRTEFMVKAGWADRSVIEVNMAETTRTLASIHQYEHVYLWFEHDLYDQLQLLQVLQWLATVPACHHQVKLIVTDLYLGPADVASLQELFRYSESMSNMHLHDANEYWLSLTSTKPDSLVSLKHSEVLPFMRMAFDRFCLEYPSVENGLSFVQNTVLSLLCEPMSGHSLFEAYQQQEKARFLGDMLFIQVLQSMLNCQKPLIVQSTINDHQSILKNQFSRTEYGAKIANNTAHFLSENELDYWLGGVHLRKDHIWCYDSVKNQFKIWDS